MTTTAPAAEVALDQLEEIVVAARPGTTLPAEAALAVRLGVSRLTVREALRALAARGLVEVSRGRRAIVRDPGSSVLSQYFAVALRRDPRGLLELNDIRHALELLSVTGAARSAGRATFTALDDALARMQEAADALGDDDGSALDAFNAADVDFHAALALGSGNRLLYLLLESLSDCLRESFEASAHGRLARSEPVDAVVSAHRAIADAVRRGDAKVAAAQMRRHLDDAATDLRAIAHT